MKSSRPLRWYILASIAAAVLVSLLPAAAILDRRLRLELEANARRDLALAPRLLGDRNEARGEMLTMHAREFAGMEGLGATLGSAVPEDGPELAAMAPAHPGEQPLLLAPSGLALVGVQPGNTLIDEVRAGGSPAGFFAADNGIHMASLSPVLESGEWMGAAGYSMPVDETMAATLAGLTGSDVVIVSTDGEVVGSTLDPELAPRMAALAASVSVDTEPDGGVGPGSQGVAEVEDPVTGRHWVVSASLGSAGGIVFVRSASTELAFVPMLRRGAVAAGALGLLVALVAGGVLAVMVARPVRLLADAADSLASGDFETPLPGSSVGELERMAAAFERMRAALAARLSDLESANAELQDRQERLTVLQSEMVQRDRLAATGRILGELAHEIRNPVANVRNCLEVVRRGAEDRPELQRFADLAIDELLRMHELAERMLDLNRPLDSGTAVCDPREVAGTVAALAGAAAGEGVRVVGEARRPAAISPEALKQVLLSLVQNASEAQDGGGGVDTTEAREPVEIRLADAGDEVTIEVVDRGPGIPEEILGRVFDPFFTTKEQASGTGLGLYVAEGVVRRHGGSLSARNREDGPGALFRIVVPPAGEDV